jgi:AAA domain
MAVSEMADFNNIPEEMRVLNRWCLFRIEEPEKPGAKAPKIPYQVGGQYKASSTNAKNLSPFSKVQPVPEGFDGINFAFMGEGLACVDLDHAIDKETRDVFPWAWAIIERIGSYTEVSYSYTGFHVVFKCKPLEAGRKWGDVELYSTGKFISMTGVVYNNLSTIVEHDISWLIAEQDAKKAAAKTAPATVTVQPGKSESETDAALALKIARANGTDFEKTKAEFLRQALARTPERAAKLKRPTYLNSTITKACKWAAEKKAEPEPTKDDYKLTRMSEYTPKALEWFWPGKIPKNKIAMFAGEPGAAKSLVTCSLAAVQSTGSCLPGEIEPSLKPAEVMMMYCEDDTEDTVLPRLIAVGADTNRVNELKITKVAKNGTKEERHVALDTDLEILRRCLRDNPGIRLVTVDPITNYTGSAKITDEKAMRDVLTPLKELAGQHEVTIILVAHLNKRSDVNALNRVLGAVAMTGVARSAWLFAADEDAPDDGFDHGLMLHGKLNVGRKAKQSLKYTIKTKKLAGLPEKAEAVPYIEWNGESEQTAEDVLDTSSGKKSEKAGKRQEAEALLRSVLKH